MGTQRRRLLCRAPGVVLLAWFAPARGRPAPPGTRHPDASWYRAAARLKRLAESWGDQPYGAVLVLDGRLVGEGPSRVVRNADPTAHAEREAIRDALRRMRGASLDGSILYSTSRPCPACEAAAAEAGVSRMFFGEGLHDAGRPSK